MNLISEQPWYYLLLCLPVGLIYAWLLYRNEQKKEGYSKTLLYTLFSFRFLSVFVLCLLLLNLLLKRSINETEKPLLIFANDNSASVLAAKDSAEIKTKFVSDLNELEKKLSDTYNVQALLFGSSVRANDTPDFKDKETDLSQLLSDIDNNYSNQNIGAVIISSDGIINRGYSNFEEVSRYKFPIYTIALGDTTFKKDLILQKINHNQVVYLGNKFPVEAVVQSIKLKGQSTTVSIYKEGSKKAEQLIKINSDNAIQTLNFVLDAEKPGVQKYRVVVGGLKEEINPNNNSHDFIVDVIDTREKILILSAAPHPDIAAIRQALEAGQTYEVESAGVYDFNKPLKPYSLIILHSVSTTNLSLINELNNNNQPYLIINPKLNESLPGLKLSSTYNKQNETEAIYNKNFSLFNISDDLKNYIKQFPAILTHFANYQTTAGANSLIYQKIGMVETENPIVLFNDNSGRKTGVIAGDGIWRWKLRDYADHKNNALFNELILKTVQYLSVKSDKSFFRLASDKIISENESIEFNAEVYNQSYQLITDPDVTISLTDSAGKQYNYTMSKSTNAYYLNSGLFPAGEYNYKATVKVNNEVFTRNGTITVKAIVAEKMNTVANHALLYQLSQLSGGKLFYKNELEQLKKELETNELIKPVTYTQKQLSDLIDLKWIFFIILGLFSLEWFLRKRSGSI